MVSAVATPANQTPQGGLARRNSTPVVAPLAERMWMCNHARPTQHGIWRHHPETEVSAFNSLYS